MPFAYLWLPLLLQKVPRRGQNPAHDAQEKSLQKLATKWASNCPICMQKRCCSSSAGPVTELDCVVIAAFFRGVVRLFNAVSKAQQQQRDAQVLGKHKIQQSKADFFQELRGDASGASNMNDKVGKLMAKATGAKAEAEAPGWSVLRDDFDLQGGGTKMKDWDREQEEEGGMPDEQLDGLDSDDGDSDAVDSEEEEEEEEEGEEEEEEEVE